MKTGIIPMTQSGAILGRPGQYKSPPFLMMPGNPVLEDATIYEFEYADNDLNYNIIPQKVKAYTYYCNLDADADWDDTPMWNSSSTTSEKKACLEARNMEGDGSQTNPWKNLTYALDQLQCFIKTRCCRYIRLVCTGTAHYTVCSHTTTFNGNNVFILDGAKIEVSRNSIYSYGFYYCRSCLFYNCSVTAVATEAGKGYCQSYGFESCFSSMFYNCSAIVKTYGGGASAYGFELCSLSTFYNCTATAESTSNVDNASAYGFSYIEGCAFYGCTVTAESSSSAGQASVECFASCDDGIFYDCKVEAEISSSYSLGYAYGFTCNSSTFYNCDAKLTATVVNPKPSIAESRALGFIYSTNLFYNCSASVSASASATPSSNGNFYETEIACGFYETFFSNCHEPCHYVSRKKDGTTDYCNS